MAWQGRNWIFYDDSKIGGALKRTRDNICTICNSWKQGEDANEKNSVSCANANCLQTLHKSCIEKVSKSAYPIRRCNDLNNDDYCCMSHDCVRDFAWLGEGFEEQNREWTQYTQLRWNDEIYTLYDIALFKNKDKYIRGRIIHMFQNEDDVPVMDIELFHLKHELEKNDEAKIDIDDRKCDKTYDSDSDGESLIGEDWWLDTTCFSDETEVKLQVEPRKDENYDEAQFELIYEKDSCVIVGIESLVKKIDVVFRKSEWQNAQDVLASDLFEIEAQINVNCVQNNPSQPLYFCYAAMDHGKIIPLNDNLMYKLKNKQKQVSCSLEETSSNDSDESEWTPSKDRKSRSNGSTNNNQNDKKSKSKNKSMSVDVTNRAGKKRSQQKVKKVAGVKNSKSVEIEMKDTDEVDFDSCLDDSRLSSVGLDENRNQDADDDSLNNVSSRSMPPLLPINLDIDSIECKMVENGDKSNIGNVYVAAGSKENSNPNRVGWEASTSSISNENAPNFNPPKRNRAASAEKSINSRGWAKDVLNKNTFQPRFGPVEPKQSVGSLSAFGACERHMVHVSNRTWAPQSVSINPGATNSSKSHNIKYFSNQKIDDRKQQIGDIDSQADDSKDSSKASESTKLTEELDSCTDEELLRILKRLKKE